MRWDVGGACAPVSGFLMDNLSIMEFRNTNWHNVVQLRIFNHKVPFCFFFVSMLPGNSGVFV